MLSLLLAAPAEAAKEHKPPISKEDLPELQRASDLLWLSWSRFAEPKNNLKYFFNVAITNHHTQEAIRRALKNTDTAFGQWPGVTFETDNDEGKVLLGKTCQPFKKKLQANLRCQALQTDADMATSLRSIRLR